MSCTDYDYVKEIQERKKRLAEINEMEAYANEHGIDIFWHGKDTFISCDIQEVDPTTGEEMGRLKVCPNLTLDILKQFFEECKQEIV